MNIGSDHGFCSTGKKKQQKTRGTNDTKIRNGVDATRTHTQKQQKYKIKMPAIYIYTRYTSIEPMLMGTLS